MTERSVHIIGRQQIELDVPSIESVPTIQEAVAQRLSKLTALEALFDRIAGPRRHVRLERVEVELGELDGADWQMQFESRFLERLAIALEQAAVPDDPSHAYRVDPQLDQYLYFLAHGRLPWWAGRPANEWPHTLLRELQPHQWQALRYLLANSRDALHRLIHGTGDELLARVLETHAQLPGTAELLSLWKPAGIEESHRVEWRLRFWLAILQGTIEGLSPTAECGVSATLRLLQIPNALFLPGLATAPGRVDTSSRILSLPPSWRGWLQEALLRTVTSPELAIRTGPIDSALDPEISVQSDREVPDNAPALPANDTAIVRRQQEPDSADTSTPAQQSRSAPPTALEGAPSSVDRMASPQAASAISQPGRSSPPRSPDHGSAPLLDGEAVHLEGAGAVILHPFLPEFFRRLDLVGKRDFHDEASRQRAVRLLALSTFGDELAPEYDLLLPKLLCGMSFEHPLPPIDLTREERRTCDDLLHAVLKHWQALKSESVDWMRQQFLLRSAKLERFEQHWTLTVERRAQDVLLDRLPWGLGVLTLPWIDRRLHVHWMG